MTSMIETSPLNLTRQDMKVLAALQDVPLRPTIIALNAGIRTMSPRETAARHCIKLVRLGFAEKVGKPMFPEWKLSEAGRAALSEETR